VKLSGVRPADGSFAGNRPRRPRRCWWETLVFPAAVLAVHQLRYLLAFGSHAGSELTARGDRYVPSAAVVAGALVAVSVGVGLLRLVAAARGRSGLAIARAPLWLLWLGLTVSLLVGFCALEGLESALEPQHAGGLVGMFGAGGG
jgi:hypothetical protein